MFPDFSLTALPYILGAALITADLNLIPFFDRFLYSLDEIQKAVEYLKQIGKICRIFAFYGPLGVGKTTLIRELLKSYDIQGPITSPTFTYLNMYKNAQGQMFYHFDLYRIAKVNDFLEAGFDEYLDDQDAICLIEWPELIEPILKNNVCKVKIGYAKEDKKRLLSCEVIG